MGRVSLTSTFGSFGKGIRDRFKDLAESKAEEERIKNARSTFVTAREHYRANYIVRSTSDGMNMPGSLEAVLDKANTPFFKAPETEEEHLYNKLRDKDIRSDLILSVEADLLILAAQNGHITDVTKYFLDNQETCQNRKIRDDMRANREPIDVLHNHYVAARIKEYTLSKHIAASLIANDQHKKRYSIIRRTEDRNIIASLANYIAYYQEERLLSSCILKRENIDLDIDTVIAQKHAAYKEFLKSYSDLTGVKPDVVSAFIEQKVAPLFGHRPVQKGVSQAPGHHTGIEP